MSLPFIDETTKHITITHFRTFNAAKLKGLESLIVVNGEHKQPAAVLVPYLQFIDLQRQMEYLTKRLAELTTDKDLC